MTDDPRRAKNPPSGAGPLPILTADEWHRRVEAAYSWCRSFGWTRNFDKSSVCDRIGTITYADGTEYKCLIDGWTDGELRQQEEDKAWAARRKEREEREKAKLYPAWPEDSENRFLELARSEADRTGTRIRKWRSGLTGVSSATTREIETPKPVSRKSLYIFLHEVGHVVLEHRRGKRAYIEEYEAEKWAINRMGELGVPVPRAMRERAKEYVSHKVIESKRHGLKEKVRGDVRGWLK